MPLCSLHRILIVFTMLMLTHIGNAQIDSGFVQQSTVLHTSTGDIFGTLTKPNDSSRNIPVVLFIAGSGPTDRDGNSSRMGLNTDCTKQLAQALARKGIASLRYDKRGIGESSASATSEKDMRFDFLVDDAKSWLAQLRKNKKFSSVIIAGHSEGSLIGMIAADKADKFISIAGAGESADLILKKQLKKQLPEGLYEESIRCIDTLKMGNYLKSTHPELSMFFRSSFQPYLISWFKYDPQVEIKKLKIPTLILQGNRDLQISEADAQLLKDAKPNSQLFIIENMNHVLKDVTTGQSDNIQSYTNPNLPIDQNLVQKIITFIKE